MITFVLIIMSQGDQHDTILYPMNDGPQNYADQSFLNSQNAYTKFDNLKNALKLSSNGRFKQIDILELG